MTRTRLLAPLVALALAASACSSASSADSTDSVDGTVSVVASTNVWADVARQVAGHLVGSKVSIKAIITDAAADPHSYEVSTRDELAIKRADLILENGGGYDDFVETMRKASGAKGTVVDAVEVSGKKKVDGELNEHVWYDFPTVAKVADRIAGALARSDRGDAATFRANARAFVAKLHALTAREATVKARYAGVGVGITEPVPLYMLDACGLVNRTPPAFSKAVEDEQEVAVRVMQQTTALFSDRQARVLVYNAQTSGPQTTEVIHAAESAGAPVVGVTETLPPGLSYLDWMSKNLTSIESALARSGA